MFRSRTALFNADTPDQRIQRHAKLVHILLRPVHGVINAAIVLTCQQRGSPQSYR